MTFFSRSRIVTWLALAAIPFAAMGPAIGNVGLVLDDWFVWRAAAEHRWYGLDGQRPLGYLPMALAHAFAGNNIAALLVFNILTHAFSGILMYEVARLVLRARFPRSGAFLAALVAAIFVVYPSDVSRYWGLASIGARFVTIELLIAALFWLLAARAEKPQLVAFALAVAAVAVLRTESGIAVLALLPLLILVYDRRPWRAPWIVPAGAWYALLGVYLIWHFAFSKPQWAFARFGAAGLDIRPIEAASPLVMAGWFLSGLYSMTAETVGIAIGRLADGLRAGTANPGLPLLAAGFGIATALTLWAANRDREGVAEIERSLDLRRWFVYVLWGLLAILAGLVPFLLNGAHYSEERIPSIGILSRYSALAAMGMSALLVTIALVPISRPVKPHDKASRGSERVDPAVNFVIAGALCAFVVALGVVRLVQEGDDYGRAWKTQKAVLRAAVHKSALWQPGAVIVQHDFPGYVNDAPMTNQSWAFRSALGLFLDPAPSGLFLTTDPGDLRQFPDNAGETRDWSVKGDTLSVKYFDLQKRLSFPLENVVVLGYDKFSKSVVVLDSFPDELLPEGAPAVPLYTGIDRPSPPRQITSAVFDLLQPWPGPMDCWSEVTVGSRDVGQREGTVSAFDLATGEMLDRRYVPAGAPLSYSFYVPCGTRGAFTFDPGRHRFIDSVPASRLKALQSAAWTAGGDAANLQVDTAIRSLPAAAPQAR